MKKEHRKDQRFSEIGRVEASEICALPGVVDDISLGGCRIHFPVPVTLDKDSEYMLKIKLFHRNAPSKLNLVCNPRWKTEDDQKTQIGFKILRSPDTPELAFYISQRTIEAEEQEASYSGFVNCSFA